MMKARKAKDIVFVVFILVLIAIIGVGFLYKEDKGPDLSYKITVSKNDDIKIYTYHFPDGNTISVDSGEVNANLLMIDGTLVSNQVINKNGEYFIPMELINDNLKVRISYKTNENVISYRKKDIFVDENSIILTNEKYKVYLSMKLINQKLGLNATIISPQLLENTIGINKVICVDKKYKKWDSKKFITKYLYDNLNMGEEQKKEIKYETYFSRYYVFKNKDYTFYIDKFLKKIYYSCDIEGHIGIHLYDKKSPQLFNPNYSQQ